MAANEVYLVPKDHLEHDTACISDELLNAIMHANQKSVFDYNFSELESKKQEEALQRDRDIKEIMDFKGVEFNDEESMLQRKYSYYEPNREFTGKREDLKLKRIDDGTFVDNGYR